MQQLRVDPEAYSDSPIFRGLLRERKGRWPGIPEDDLPPFPAYEDLPSIPVMSLVKPILPENLFSPAKEFLAYDPEATHPMPLPSLPEGD